MDVMADFGVTVEWDQDRGPYGGYYLAGDRATGDPLSLILWKLIFPRLHIG